MWQIHWSGLWQCFLPMTKSTFPQSRKFSNLSLGNRGGSPSPFHLLVCIWVHHLKGIDIEQKYGAVWRSPIPPYTKWQPVKDSRKPNFGSRFGKGWLWHIQTELRFFIHPDFLNNASQEIALKTLLTQFLDNSKNCTNAFLMISLLFKRLDKNNRACVKCLSQPCPKKEAWGFKSVQKINFDSLPYKMWWAEMLPNSTICFYQDL